jgi:hypothetical protein
MRYRIYGMSNAVVNPYMNPHNVVPPIARSAKMLAIPTTNESIGNIRTATKAVKALAGIGAGAYSMFPFRNKKAMNPATSPPSKPCFIVI